MIWFVIDAPIYADDVELWGQLICSLKASFDDTFNALKSDSIWPWRKHYIYGQSVWKLRCISTISLVFAVINAWKLYKDAMARLFTLVFTRSRISCPRKWARNQHRKRKSNKNQHTKYFAFATGTIAVIHFHDMVNWKHRAHFKCAFWNGSDYLSDIPAWCTNSIHRFSLDHHFGCTAQSIGQYLQFSNIA